MRANRRTDTKPELALRHALHRLGYRYRKDYRLDLDGGRRVRPDIAFTARKVAVFVDGCFWHACPEHGSKPRANEWYWGPKLVRNVERDRINDAALILAGWTVVRLWEHVPLDEAISTVVTALAASTAPNPAAAPDPDPDPARRPGEPGRHSQLGRPGRPPEANPARHRRFSWLARLARRRLWQTLGHHARVPAFDAPGAGRGPAGRPGRLGPGPAARVRGHARAARGVRERRRGRTRVRRADRGGPRQPADARQRQSRPAAPRRAGRRAPGRTGEAGRTTTTSPPACWSARRSR